MDREEVLTWMAKRGLNNRQLAQLIGISEDKVSKSLAATGKPRKWQGAEVMKLIDLMRDQGPLVRSEVRGTGMSAAAAREAIAMRNGHEVPLLGSAFGGDWEDLEGVEMTELHLSDVLDYVARPASLAGDDGGYVVEIVGESMVPRFEPGERAFVSPKASVRPGDDVVVQLTDPNASADMERRVTMVLIKRLVRQTATEVELLQFNPSRSFRVPISRIARDAEGRRAIHRVRGRL